MGDQFEYRTEIISEWGLSTILLGNAKTNAKKVQEIANILGNDGRELVSQSIEHRRKRLFFSVEALILNFKRKKHFSQASHHSDNQLTPASHSIHSSVVHEAPKDNTHDVSWKTSIDTSH